MTRDSLAPLWRPSLLLAVVALCGPAACRCDDRPELHVRAQKGRLLAQLDVRASAAARGAGNRLAIGTDDGGLIVVRNGERHVLLPAPAPPASAPASGGDTAPRARPRHEGVVVALDFSSDGKRLFSVGGRTAIWWDVNSGEMIRQVRGPQTLTAGLLAPDGKAGFFSTLRGHVMRWRFDKKEAEAVNDFGCRPSLVREERKRLPPAKRCPVGTYDYVEDKSLCFFRVTQLVRRGPWIARACREGTVGVLDTRTRGLRWSNVAGALGTLSFVDDDHLLFGRSDGQIQLWSLADKSVVQSYGPSAPAHASAAAGDLIAVAQRDRIRIWQRDNPAPVGAVKVPAKVVWLQLSAKPFELQALLADGRLIAHTLTRQTP